MSAVVFAIGSKPGLSEHQALALAEALGRTRSIRAQHLASRIRAQAALDPDELPPSSDVTLDQQDLEALARYFAEIPDLNEIPAFAHLNDEVVAALERRE